MSHFRIQTTDGTNYDFSADGNEMTIVSVGQEDALIIKDSSNSQVVVAFPLREVKLAFRSDIPIGQ